VHLQNTLKALHFLPKNFVKVPGYGTALIGEFPKDMTVTQSRALFLSVVACPLPLPCKVEKKFTLPNQLTKGALKKVSKPSLLRVRSV